MKCENCGAVLDEGATVCPECGTPVASGADAAGSPRSRAKSPGGKRAVVLLVTLAALVVVAVGGYFIFTQFTASNSPDAAAVRMMNAFAAYDAEGILDNATHSSLTATDQATFAQQATDSKKKNGGLPAVKNIAVTKVTLSSQDATSATVQLTAQWLTDASSKKYVARTETLTVVKQDGKWLVRLF